MAGSRPERLAWRVAALLVGAAVLLVYRTTLLPGVSLWDTAEAQTALPLMGTMHPTGFPAFVLVGWLASVILAPLGEPAFRMNALAAILVATAVGLLVPLVRRLDVPLPVAVAAALGFALTPIAWSISTAADAHTLHVVLVALVVLALVRWDRLVDERARRPDDVAAARRADRAIVLAAALFGVALANHGLAVLLVPAIALYVLAVERGVLRRPKLIVTALGTCLGVTALLYLELPLRAGPFPAPLIYGHPETWSGFWDIVLARQFLGGVRGLVADLGPKALDLASLAGSQLGPLAFLVPPALVVTAIRFPRYALLSGVAAGVTCLFAASYVNANIGRYYLGPLLFAWTWLAIAAGALVRLLVARGRRRAADVDDGGGADPPAPPGPPAARTAVALLVALVMLVPTGVVLSARWQAADRSGETTMAEWLDDAMTTLPPEAVVVSWWSLSTPLWYGTLVEGRRPDLVVVDDSDIVNDGLGSAEDVIDTYLGLRPVYVIRSSASDVEALAVRYVLEPVGRPIGVYRVVGLQETQP